MANKCFDSVKLPEFVTACSYYLYLVFISKISKSNKQFRIPDEPVVFLQKFNCVENNGRKLKFHHF